MKQEKFFELIKTELNVESTEINAETEFLSLKEYDSLAKLYLITLADEHFGAILEATKIDSLVSVNDYMNLIGREQFEGVVATAV